MASNSAQLEKVNEHLRKKIYETAEFLQLTTRGTTYNFEQLADGVSENVREMRTHCDRLQIELQDCKQSLCEYAKLSLPRRHEEAQQEVKKERHRYNDLLGLRIRQDPRFQDLNDGGRPELVVRKFQDICNQERLDAADELEDEGVTTDMETLELLCDIMMESWKFATSILDDKLNKVSQILEEQDWILVDGEIESQQSSKVGEGMKMEVVYELKTKDPASFVTNICQKVTEHFQKQYSEFGREGSEVEAFTKACAEVSWMIVLAVPFMTLDVPKDDTFEPKHHVLYPECRVEEGVQITKCLWPALRFTSLQTPEVKAHVFTEIPGKPYITMKRQESWRMILVSMTTYSKDNSNV